MWNKQYHEKEKVHSLYGHLLDMIRLRAAWMKVKRNDGAGGVDKVTIGMFERQLDLQLRTLQRQLQEKTYCPQPVRRVQIEKDGSSKLRDLGIPTIRDRIVQQVLKDLLEPIFDPHFSPHSHGYRPGHSQHGALDEVKVFRERYDWVLDADIKGFFDNVDHEVLLDLVNERVSDGSILKLLRMFLESGVYFDGVVHPSDVGTPQGGVISPLLANIYLNHLDRHLSEHEVSFVRYADDLVVFCESRTRADALLCFVRKILEGDLHVELSVEKTRIVTLGYEVDKDGNIQFHPDHGPFNYLGFRVSRSGMSPCARSLKKFKDKIRALTIRCRTYELSSWFARLNRTIRGWCNYFGYGTVNKLFRQLSQWIRDRVRLVLGRNHKRTIRYNRRSLNSLRLQYTNAVLCEMGLITPDYLLDS
jgi:group II intron reverse transcriptase/maturase